MWISLEEATSGFNCVCCRERVRTCEKYLQVRNDRGSKVRGERYCTRCEQYARINNDVSHPIGRPPIADDVDDERGLRQRERFAAYQAAGCTHAFWGDEDAHRD